MVRTLALVALLSFPVIASAQDARTPPPADTVRAENDANAQKQAETGQPPQRIRNIALSGNTPCPKASDPSEVVVCSRIEEPYRIPKPLRDKKPIPMQGQAWANRAAAADEVGKRAAGLPDTCSTVGSGGQTGCTMQQIQRWTAERAAKKRGEQIDPDQ